MIAAAIDIGTNSTRLFIASIKNNQVIPLKREMVITRLGKGLKDSGLILDENFKNTVKVIEEYKKECIKYGVEMIKAVGTNALREAVNAKDFIDEVFKKTNIKVEIISSDVEAQLSFCGAVKSIEQSQIQGCFKFKNSKDVLVIDVGGGSSELIFGNIKGEVKEIKGIDIGCVNVSEQFIKSDPPSKFEIDNMVNYIRERLFKELKFDTDKEKMISKKIRMIGLAGTISSIASIYLGLKKYEMEKLNFLCLKLSSITKIFKNLCKLDLPNRKKVIGLEPGRADVIIGGSAIVIELMRFFKKRKLMVSEHDILDGIIYSLIDF